MRNNGERLASAIDCIMCLEMFLFSETVP